MKKNISDVLSAVTCVLIIICLFQISALKSQVRNLQNDLISHMSTVDNSISNVYSSVYSAMEEQTSLLSVGSWKFGKVDFDAMTVILNCAISPKEYATNTEAAIIIDGAEHAMTLGNGGKFIANIEIPLFSETHVSTVIFREDESIRTEALDWHVSPQYDYFPEIYADLDGSATGSSQDGLYVYHRKGVVNVDAYCKDEGEIKSATLVEMLDGKKLSTTDIPLDNKEFFENYQSESGARPENVAAAQSTTQVEGHITQGPFYYALDKDYEIPYGSMLTLYVEVEDGNGFLYRCVIDHMEVSDSGEPIDDDYLWAGMDASIYDTNGQVLYEGSQ